MSRWARAVAGVLAICLAAGLAWAQQSTESSRPIRGTGTPGFPADGVLTIQGVLQGRPVTVDYHHAANLTVAHVTSVVHVQAAGAFTVQPGNTANTTAWLTQTQHVSAVVHVTTGQSPHVTSFAVINCGTTVAVAVQPKGDNLGRRRDVILQNAGSGTIFVGGSHVTLTAAQGLGLHSGAVATGTLTLSNFQGRVDCITVTDTQTLKVLEIWR